MDAHASVTKSDPDCVTKSRTLAERKLDALYRGEIRTFSAPRAADPTSAEIRRLAANIVQKMHAADLAKVPAKDRLAQLRTLVTAYVAEHQSQLRPVAERRLRELDELGGPSTVDEPPAEIALKQSKKSKRS